MSKRLIIYRSDPNDVIKGFVLELMFELSTEEYVYRYEDFSSKTIEYIGVNDLDNVLCEWGESLSNFEKSADMNRKKSRIASKGTYSEVFGPAMSSFDVVVFPEGTKRKRKLNNA